MEQLNPVKDFKQVDNDIYLNPVLGDFELVPSDNQHILDICDSYPGWWKNALKIGAGLPNLLKSKVTTGSIENLIKAQLESDGYQVGRPVIRIEPNGRLTIIPYAVRK